MASSSANANAEKDDGDGDIVFWKYQGTSNDFVMIDNTSANYDDVMIDEKWLQRLCDRRIGIGADGVIEIRRHPKYSFEMKYFNSDGRLSTFCGNGARCAVAFARELQLLQFNEATFLAVDGEHYGVYDEINNVVHIKFKDVKQIEREDDNFFVNTGSPHYIKIVEDLDEYDVYTQGHIIRNDKKYRDIGGTNANFMQLMGPAEIRVRTFERGVEDETHACGTGCVAAALTHAKLRGAKSGATEDPSLGQAAVCTRQNCFLSYSEHRHIITLGGELIVSFETKDFDSFSDVYLIGPAVKVFTGKFPSPREVDSEG